MSKLDTTIYNAVVGNTAFQTVLDSTKIRNWRQNLQAVTDANSPEGQYAADAGTTDTYAITLSPVPTAYFAGMVVRFKANTANTGAATLNVNILGAKTIKKGNNTDLETGDILANQFVEVLYDGTNFQLLSQSSNNVKRTGDTFTGNVIVPAVSTASDTGIFGLAGATEIWAIVRTSSDTNFRTIGHPLFNGLMVGQGAGSPEGVVTAPVGALFRRTDGGATTTLYVKTSGTGNTGWTAK